MKHALIFAVLAGTFWGVGGFFEKTGLQALKLPPIVGISLRTFMALILLGIVSLPSWRGLEMSTHLQPWLMIMLGGGVLAGSLGMWCFYTALAHSQNLGVTLAVAFAFSPIAGSLVGLIQGTQTLDGRTALGMIAIIGGMVLIQLAHHSSK